jgi:ATP-dependent 26S proteasome regulatory subunit
MTSAQCNGRQQLQAAQMVELWQQHVRGPHARERLSADLRRALAAAEPEAVHALLEWLARGAADREALTAAVEELRAGNELLGEKLQALLRPPLALARLLAVDAARQRAFVALSPTARAEVALHHELQPAALVPGRDVVLTAERNCVLRVLAREDAPAAGAARVVAFRGFLGSDGGAPLRRALAGDGGGELPVWVPADVGARVEALLAEGRGTIRLCIDEFAQAFALCGDEAADPRALAPRFLLPLEPVTVAGVVGLAAQRTAVEDAVRRACDAGALVLAQGTTGCGKSHLARYALHLMQQRGATVVLGLRSTPDHRYYGQVESDVESLFQCARGLVAAGQQALVFVDEIDRHFYRSDLGTSVHVNSTRATWLAQIGDETRLRGLLVYATTNKADRLPSELLNRVTHPLNFGAIDRAQVEGLLELYLGPAVAGARRAEVIEAVVQWTHDRVPGSEVAVVTLRDQQRLPLFPCDLRQLSGRFYRELALRLGEAARADGGLTVELALLCTIERLHETVHGLGLSRENVAERTFADFPPRNPVDCVEVAPPSPGARQVLFRYRPLEIEDAAPS